VRAVEYLFPFGIKEAVGPAQLALRHVGQSHSFIFWEHKFHLAFCKVVNEVGLENEFGGNLDSSSLLEPPLVYLALESDSACAGSQLADSLHFRHKFY
jgi:hypothetical protein